MVSRRLEPDPWDPSYLVLRSLATQMRSQIADRLAGRVELEVLDIGCGRRPFEPLFEPFAARYVGVDNRPGPKVDVVAPAESLPFEDQSFDAVLSSQVLEHVDDPAAVVAELSRVLRPGGVAFASTHGVARYHPNPDDFWRWTHAGLARLFHEAGDWSALDVYPNGGNGTALGYLFSLQMGSAFRQLGLTRAIAPLTFIANVLAWNLDRLYRRRLPTRSPDLVANYLVVAVSGA